jgi:hypothetical protein
MSRQAQTRCPWAKTELYILQPLAGKWSGTASELYPLVVQNWPGDTRS